MHARVLITRFFKAFISSVTAANGHSILLSRVLRENATVPRPRVYPAVSIKHHANLTPATAVITSCNHFATQLHSTKAPIDVRVAPDIFTRDFPLCLVLSGRSEISPPGLSHVRSLEREAIATRSLATTSLKCSSGSNFHNAFVSHHH